MKREISQKPIISSQPICNSSCRDWSGVLWFHAHPPKDTGGAAFPHWKLTPKFKTMLRRLTAYRLEDAKWFGLLRKASMKPDSVALIFKRLNNKRRLTEVKKFDTRYRDVIRFANGSGSANGMPVQVFPMGLQGRDERRSYESFLFELSGRRFFQDAGGRPMKNTCGLDLSAHVESLVADRLPLARAKKEAAAFAGISPRTLDRRLKRKTKP